MIVLVKVTFYLDSYLYKSLAVFSPKLLTFFVTFLITQINHALNFTSQN